MSDLTLEDVLIFDALDYKEVSGSSGDQLNIKACPNCGKERWKVYANKSLSVGNCFSCNESFNLFKFVRWTLIERGGMGATQDVRAYLADVSRKLGYRPKVEMLAPKVMVEEGAFELPQSSELPYTDGKNHPYLESRGITGEYAKRFGLRYSLFGWHGYLNQKGETVKQSFAERIIIPVYNLDGLCVTFQGRDVTGIAEAKYKFAGGLPGTARYLYNGHTAKALHGAHALMCEGPTDVIKAQVALDQAPDLARVVPVGSFGMTLSSTKVGDDQVGAFQKLKAAGLNTVTIMWDAEPEAYSRALDAGAMLTKIGLTVRVACLPAGLDPGAADASVIQRAVREATEFTRLSRLRMSMRNPYR